MNALILSFSLLTPIILLLMWTIPYSFSNTNIRFKAIMSAISLALIAGPTAGLWLFFNKATEVNLFSSEIGLTIRIDALSILIYTMISVIAMVVIRFSKNYLEGDPKHENFLSKMAFTIGLVMLFVISGHLFFIALAWVGTSLGLQSLLVFHKERAKAKLAARKKFIIARLGDLALIGSFMLIYGETGTGNLSDIFAILESYDATNLPFIYEVSGGLLVLAAALKSVQIPSHVWLLDVMETPTPVSALLHAGLLNAGPFLIIRFAHFIDLTSFATLFLILLGGASAIYGAISASTQPTIKNALAYSSIGHMGFTLMLSGLGVYSASLLHLMAHSFYKAHAFLSSGSSIDKIQVKSRNPERRTYHTLNIFLGFVTSGGLFALSAYFWQISPSTEFQLLFISAIIFLGVFSLQTNLWAKQFALTTTLKLIFRSALVINSFFFLEHGFALMLSNQIPDIRFANTALVAACIAIFILFMVKILLKSWLLNTTQNAFVKKLEIHFRNGLYFNQIMNRMINSLNTKNYN